ncbi:MAG: hypothetical protein ABI175_24415 [Polyangiales bacterium]
MRVALSLLFLLLCASCGPSMGQIKTARTAVYTAAPNQLLDIAVQVAQRTYKVKDIDPAKGMFITEGQWYTPDGGRIGTTDEGNGDYVNAGGGDVRVAFEVRLIPVDAEATNRFSVAIEQHTFQLVSGSPQPRELKTDDPALPPWVKGRVDSLAVDIYEAAKPLVHP